MKALGPIKPWLAIAAYILCCAALLGLTYKLAFDRALNSLSQQTERTADLFRANIESTVNRYSYLPRVIATRPAVIKTLAQATEQSVRQLSYELEVANDQAGTLTIYAMDNKGLTIASSNHAEVNSFVGKNFSFRPYYRFAIRGDSGRYFALGTTSGKRGYYFSSPIKTDDSAHPIGAIVVKVGLEQLEDNWQDKNPIALLTDQHEVVFSGNKAEWVFKSLSPLSPMAREELRNSRQYHSEALDTVRGLSYRAFNGHRLAQIRAESTDREFLHLKHPIAQSGWWLHTLADTKAARVATWRDTISVAISLALVTALLLYFVQRRRNWQLLEQAKLSLEEKVASRTTDLTAANHQLKREAEQKQLAFSELKAAQEKLLHSNRLATIGELSTAITHELNQPITAISSYSNNAQIFIDQKNYQQVSKNLQAIDSLTKRMSEISNQLRNHAGKGEDALQTVNVHEAVENALAIVKPKIEQHHVQVTNNANRRYKISTQQIRLEQILVNLLINACDAVSDKELRAIDILTEQRDELLAISICDSGNGIEPSRLESIFEPFFTTKGKSEGLGLGLSISQSIATSLNGTLLASNNSAGGACFCLSLPIELDNE
ncbi:MAG: sensor histidine kinase [Granulosicoccaceae bacterium]